MDITPKSPPENIILKALSREAVYALKEEAIVFAHPRGARILTPPDGEQFKISIPVAIQTWWMLVVFLVAAVWFILMPVGLTFSIVAPTWDRPGYFNPLPVIIAVGVCIILSWVVMFRLCFARIVIEGTREGVTVGKYKFDWRALGGFRLGSSAGGEERQNTQQFLSFSFQGMHLGYGPYGFDLPYMVNSYYAAYYVVWLNEMLATVGANDKTGANDPQSGFKKAMF